MYCIALCAFSFAIEATLMYKQFGELTFVAMYTFRVMNKLFAEVSQTGIVKRHSVSF